MILTLTMHSSSPQGSRSASCFHDAQRVSSVALSSSVLFL
ncbi:hypothetical protein E2C01_081735 [Portunus trituberculatus]|uniref:Uncharacterized protein n=1 Tax=Portunus trituberculatus TaxID=210409 RepID=A0A5B7IZN5_PORTR|nr:hypothetical protein [Portunus trituberculatus]